MTNAIPESLSLCFPNTARLFSSTAASGICTAAPGLDSPRSNQDYWKPKIERNIQRDAENKQKFELDGWKVIVVWECELKKRIAEERLSRLCEEITGDCNFDKYKQVP